MSWADDDSAPWDLGDEAPAEGAEGAEEGAAEGAAAKTEEAASDAPVKPKRDKAAPPHYTYHWVRPLFLNYGYIKDYRHNYYDDYIDYMDKRNKGLYREVPRAQEWPERVLRTFTEKNKGNESHKQAVDLREISGIRHEPRYYSYHTRAYYSLKYQKIL